MKQRNFQVFAAITVMLLLSGCPAILNSTNDDDSTTTTTTLSELETRTLYNEDAASGYGGKLAVVSGGRQYIVQNNIIDSVAAQKVEYETSTGNFVIKEHTGSSASLAVSFPSIFIGNNNGHATTDSNLPKRNGAIGSLQTGWTWSKSGVSASADFLPLINLWFTASETGNILGPEKWLEIWMAKPTSHNPSAAFDAPAQTSGGEKFSLIDLMDTHRIRLSSLPALSFVPEARAPPKGCWPTTAPVDLSLM